MKKQVAAMVAGAGLVLGCVAVIGCSTGLNAKADSNRDGGVSPQEFDAYMKEAIFAEFDTNENGYVTLEEWRRVNPEEPVSDFKKADADGDGRVSRKEANDRMSEENSMEELFKKVDANHDGKLSEQEIAAFRAKFDQQPGPTKIDQLKQASQDQ